MKKLACLALLLSTVACGEAKNEEYYRDHPKELMSFLKTCSLDKSETLCQRLQPLGEQVERALVMLQSDPQAFGSQIIAEQVALSKTTDSNERQKLEAELRFKRAMTAWVESPERE